ncbi:MAG TPA: diaminopimelate decarboxylase [Bacilli bacterium]|jgi:diaminopimelate decarboxylase|nr:diaminopimelate decarboxylase [Acholeplasmataceae bacterium]HOA78811.1 diaminopimelate decarboxylase [Bacilli bacterium]
MRTKSMTVKNGELYIGDFSLSELSARYRTPLYVYDEEGIIEKINIFKEYFRSDKFATEIVYASKAFLAPYLCKILAGRDISIDAVSVGDLHLIEKSGFPNNRILLHGNNKSNGELEKAVEMGVEYVVVDSYTELARLKDLSEKKEKHINTLFRINPGIYADTHAYIETSLLSSKFGESIHDEEIIDKVVDIYRRAKYLRLDGFHCHIGSQINNPKSFIAAAQTMLNFTKRFAQKYGMEVDVLNLGGGFAIKYLENDAEVDLRWVLTEIIKTVESRVEKYGLKLKKLMIEPGRALVGDSGFTLYRVGLLKKTFGGKKYIFIDGGMSDNIRPALYQAKFTVEVANRVAEPDDDSDPYPSFNFYDVVGKCCESADIIAEAVNIDEVRIGDIIVVYATGAYCYSMSMNYNGLQRGAVIFVKGDKITEAIRRQSLDDLVATCDFGVTE